MNLSRQEILTAIGSAFVLSLLLSFAGPASAAEDINRIKREYNQIQKEIDLKKGKLEDANKLEEATLDDLDATNRELKKASDSLKAYKKKLGETRRRTNTVRAETATVDLRIRKRQEWIKRRLRAMHRFGGYGETLLVLGASDDLSGLLRRWRYMEELNMEERRVIGEYRNDIALLKKKQAELSALSGRLETEAAHVSDTEKGLELESKRKKDMLLSIREKKSAYAKMLRDLRESSRKMLEIIRESEKADTFAGRGFRELKGRIPWPVRGPIAVPYGTTEDPRFKTPVFRNGIYISAEEGVRAKAVHRGEVIFASWFKGYGQLVILNHGEGYHTLYANLSEIFLKQGDIIERGADIGNVGQSGLLERPSLYFEIRYKGKALDPTQWLAR